MLGSKSSAGYFLPVFTGLINEGSPVLEVTEGQCFGKIIFKLEKVVYDEASDEISEIHVNVNATQPKSYMCYDWFALVTHEFQNFQTFFHEGESKIVYKNLPPGTKYDLKVNGLRVYIFCQGYLNTAASIYNMVKMFLGGLTTYTWLPVFGSHVPKYMVEANIDFLKNTMQWELEPREISYIDYNESNFKTGDVLAIFRLDGVD